ncbi:MAG TPA: polysaccharide deacetylase family protein [Thermoanaerobaculia bacterium]|nr:polysaccharide deacetylase family protein [Thermoanaerobaculia bacterium]
MTPGTRGRPPRASTPVLMLHHVEPAPLDPPALHPDSYLTPDELGADLDRLAGWGFSTVTLATAAASWHSGRKLPAKSLVLTFDDACSCFLEHALPVLAAHDATATVFAVAGLVGADNAWDRAAGERHERLMDGAALAEVAATGCEVGSHGRTHRDLSRLEGAGLDAEVAGSKRLLEGLLGRPVTTLAWPYGRTSVAARRRARDAGYQAAVAIHDHAGAVAGDPWALPRQPLRPGEGSFELWLKARRLYAPWSRLPRLGILGSLRRWEARRR